MLQQSPSNPTLDLIKLILPVVTFFLGYVLSSFDKFRESKRKLRNMKSILFKEIKENYKLLNHVVPKKEQTGTPIPDLTALLCQELSFSIYEQYLGRLDDLTSKELDMIYDAYFQAKQAAKAGESYLSGTKELKALGQLISEQQKDSITARATQVVMYAETAFEKMEAALGLFKGGKEVIEDLDKVRGGALATYQQVSEMLNKDRQSKESKREDKGR
jgi:hypothetical protein